MRTITSLPIAAILACVMLLPAGARSQEAAYKFDLGGSLGISGYLGDANTSSLFKHTGVAASVNFRYLLNTRMAIRCSFTYAGLSGDSAEMENIAPGGATYKFTSSVYDLGGRFEFNLFNYGIGETYRKLRRWSPYIAAGLGFNVASSGGSTAAALDLPLAIGVKYKIKPRLNLTAEWTMTKTFGDKLDSPELSDLQGIKSSFIKNTDWFSTLTIGLSYEFGERCKNCFYVD